MARRSPLEAQLRQRQAVMLRLAGKTYQQIADTVYEGTRLYGTATAARDAIVRVLKQEYEEYAGTTEDLRTLELARLDALYGAHLPRALRGDDKSTQRCNDITKLRVAISGFAAPQKIETTVNADESTLQALALLAELKQATVQPEPATETDQ